MPNDATSLLEAVGLFLLACAVVYVLARSIASTNPVETIADDARALWRALRDAWEGLS